MKEKISRRIKNIGLSSILGLSVACSSFYENTDKPFIGEYKTVSEKSNAMLSEERVKINAEIVYDQPLNIYEGEKFKIQGMGDRRVMSYNSRNIDASTLKGSLEQQLSGIVDVVSVVPETNQLLVRYVNSGEVEQQIQKFVEGVDISPPQIALEMRMVKKFADDTMDLSSVLEIIPKEGENGIRPAILLDLPGARLRVPERAAELGLGVKYGIVGEAFNSNINFAIDQLRSQGFAEDIAKTNVVASGKPATIRLIQELPYREEALSNNGTLLALTKYKEIKNFMEITPHARDDGYIYLMIKGGVSSFNPTGVLQIPGITSRDIDIGGVYLKKGETLILGGFRVDHNLAVERREPFLSKIPVIKYIVPWAKDKERSMNEILFIVTPHYADVSQGSKKQEESFFNYKSKGWILENIVDEGLERPKGYRY